MSIDDRPLIFYDKSSIGEWKIGAVIGKGHGGALVAIVGRVTNSMYRHKLIARARQGRRFSSELSPRGIIYATLSALFSSRWFSGLRWTDSIASQFLMPPLIVIPAYKL